MKILEKIITHDILHPDFWDNNVMKKSVRINLLEIVKEFLKENKIIVPIKDIILTGSLAGNNYTEYSDLDVHIILDFEKFDASKEITKEWLDLIKWKWNELHDIFIHDHEVELYFQDISEEHTAPGIYSILHNKWVQQPTFDEIDVDENKIKNKAEKFMEQIDASERSIKLSEEKVTYEKIYLELKGILSKIRDMRKSGLKTKEGMYSIENLTFKELRNNGYIEKLAMLIDSTYDKIYKIQEVI